MNFKKICFLGDSITFGSKTSGEEYRFSNLVENRTGIKCLNYGISGTRIARQDKGDEDSDHRGKDMYGRSSELDKNADLVILFGGTNDYGHGTAGMGNFDEITPYTFCGALSGIYKNICELMPNAKFAIITPCHRRVEEEPRLKDDGNYYTLKDYIEKIREFASENNIPTLDLFAHDEFYYKVPGFTAKYMPDGLHPNDNGHIWIADRICEFLQRL